MRTKARCPMPPRFQSLWMIGLFGLALFALAIDQAFADGHEPVFDVYALSAEADAEIDNDLMVATLLVQAQNSDPAALADRINGDMDWALGQLDEFPGIERRTLDYQTRPRYEGDRQQRVIGWSASQALELRVSDAELAADAIARLQERLQLVGMYWTTLPFTRRQVENRLIEEALNAFRDRALLVQQTMNSGGYRIVEMRIGDRDDGTGYRQRGFAMEADARVAAPSFEGGTSRITMRVDGRIQLD